MWCGVVWCGVVWCGVVWVRVCVWGGREGRGRRGWWVGGWAGRWWWWCGPVCSAHVSVDMNARDAPNYGGHVPVDMAPRPCTCVQSPKKSPFTVSEHCNCEGFALFCTLNHPATVVAHNGKWQRQCPCSTGCNCGSSAVSSTTEPEEFAEPAQPASTTLSNVLQLENLYGVLNSQDQGELPLRHDRKNRRPRSNVLQLRSLHSLP